MTRDKIMALGLVTIVLPFLTITVIYLWEDEMKRPRCKFCRGRKVKKTKEFKAYFVYLCLKCDRRFTVYKE